MKIPEIYDLITTDDGIELCRSFNLDYLVQRIESNRENYKRWEFDGCSCFYDKLLGFLTRCNWKDITFKCCLPHDLGYAYGESGNKKEKKQVDLKFYNNLKEKAGMHKLIAFLLYSVVRIGGAEKFGFTFSWSFASK